jgi:8-oxo-dGTP pyrophosphatase MutT (NUDIX family)
LHLRQNTGWSDGFYGLVSGHIDGGETLTQAMVREAKEEAGIIIAPKDLKLVTIFHRKSDREYMDCFFSCYHWHGSIENREPEKCGGLDFYSVYSLPKNVVAYVRKAIECSLTDISFCEFGWV